MQSGPRGSPTISEATARLRAAGERFVRRVSEAAEVRPDERGAFFAAAGFQLCFVAGAAVLKAATNALLLARVEDPRVLPALYVASSLVAGVIALAHGLRGVSRREPPSLALLGWLGLLLGLAALVPADAALVVPALYLAAETYTTVVSVRFWSMVGEGFDLRASRRLLTLIGGVGMGGSILGGAVAGALGPRTGALSLVLVACASMPACAALVRGLPRGEARARALAPPASAAPVHERLRRDSLTRNMALLAVLLAAASSLADYVFRFRARESLGDGELAALFGGMSMAIGAIAMSIQFLASRALLRHVGIFGFLALAPTAGLGFAAAAMLTPALWPAYALKVVEQVGSYSLTQTGMQLLYTPIPDAYRAAARSAVDGLARKFGHVAAGGLLVMVAAKVSPTQPHLPWITALCLVAALAAIFQIRRHYVRAIGERLGARSESVEESSLAEGTGRRAIESALRDPDEARVVAALGLLSRDRAVRLENKLAPLLEHASPRVRAAAAKLAGERGVQGAAVRLGELAADASEPAEVREAAITAVARLRPLTASRLFAPLLRDDDLGVRDATIAALVPLDPRGPAAAVLEQLLDEPGADPSGRARQAALLGRLGPGSYAPRLLALLRDPELPVRRAACAAAGECREPLLVDALFELLVLRDTRRDARAALARYGDAIVDRVARMLNDRSLPADLRYRLPRLLREIGSSRAAEAILFSNIADDPFLQYRLCVAVSRLRERHPEAEVDRQRALQAASRRLAAYELLLPVARDLEAALGPRDLLVRAVHDRLDQAMEGAIRLVGLVFPRAELQNAFNRFVHGSAETRSFAVEMVENVIEDGISRRFAAALERWHRLPDETGEGRAERAPARLRELVAATDPVLRAVAITTVRHLAALRGAAEASSAPTRFEVLARMASGPAWETLLGTPPKIPEEWPVNESTVEKVLFLEGVDIFAESDVDDLAALAERVTERRYAKGELIYRENDPGDALYVIVEGQVRVDKEGRHILDLGPRDSFGETSLLDGKPRPATARAATDLRVLVLQRAEFLDLVSDRVELLRGIFSAVTRHLRSVLDAAAAGRITSPSLAPVSLPRMRERAG